MRRALRWIKRIVLGTLALVVVVVGVALIVLHTDWGRNKAREVVLANIQKFFPGGIHVERIDGSVLGELELSGITINGLDGKQMITAKTARANLAFGALFGGTIEIEYVELDDVVVTDPSNPVYSDPNSPPLEWDVALPEIRVRRATIAMSGEQPMTFEAVDLDASLAVPAFHPLYVNVERLAGTWKERGLAFEVATQANIGDRIEVPLLRASLGDTTVTGDQLVVDLGRPTGKLTVHATPAVVAKLAPAVALPAPAELTIDLTAAGTETRVELAGTMGTASLDATLVGDITARSARGMIAANGIDLATIVGGPQLTGGGSGVVAVTIDPERVHATAVVHGQVLDLPAGDAIIEVDATRAGIHGMVVAGGAGDSALAVIGRLKIDGMRVELVDSHVVGTMRDASVVTAGKLPFRGALTVGGRARGTIAPELRLALDGHVRGSRLASTDPKLGGIRIAHVSGRAEGTISEAGTFTRFQATVKNVSRGGSPLGTFEVDGRNRRDGKIALTLTARPAMIKHGTAQVAATISLGKMETDPIEIELGEHSLKTPRVAWAGSGGSIVIGEEAITISGFESRAGKSTVALDSAKLVKATDELAVKATVRGVPLSTVDPTFRGTVSATVDLKRRGIAWNGTANVTAHGIQLAPDQPAIEGTARVTIANRRVQADVTASTFQVGGVRLVLDVDGPRDITDPLAWRRLERKAIRTALLGVTRIDLAAAKVPTGGIIDGELVLAGMDTNGSFTIKSVETALGAISGEINFAPLGDELGVSSTLNVENVGEAQISGQIVIPSHPFDPAEWQKLGRGVARVVKAQIEDVVIDPVKLRRIGIDAPYRGRASVEVVLVAGESKANATIDLRGVSGGPLVKPIDLRIEAGTTATATTASVQARAANKKPTWAAGDARLLAVTAALPNFGFENWLADPGAVMAAPLTGRLEIPDLDVVRTLAMFGRADVQSGRVRGAITFGGTAGKPTATGDLVVTNVSVKPRLAGRKLPVLEELRITPTWDGAEATLAIKGRESDGATLDITARARPEQLDKLYARVLIRDFDIAPIAVFLPGPLVAATGKLTVDVTATGLGVDAIRGSLKVKKARVPIHPQVGTIRDANVEVDLTDAGLRYELAAKLGAGRLELKGGAQPDLKVVTFAGVVSKLSPIGEYQPVIDAKLAGTIFREEGLLRADARLTDTSVSLNLDQGIELLDAEMPEDLYIGRKSAPPPTPKQARLPRKPWITIKATVASTPIHVKHEFFEVRARANVNRGITVSVGRSLGMDGSIEIERGDVNVLGRQYRVDPGPDKIRFDGTIDPLLALRLTHDFPELTLTADIVGRASKREIVMTGTPAIYTQDELFAFFIGAEPSGGSNAATRDVASNVGAAYLSAKLQRHAKKVIPFKVDVVGCDAGTAASSSACRLGRWLTENWFVQFKQRIEPRPDEPPQEVQLQYYFRRNWVIEAAGFTERFGGDILWRKRW